MSVESAGLLIDRRWAGRARMAWWVSLFIGAVVIAGRVAAMQGRSTTLLTNAAFLLISATAAGACFFVAHQLRGQERESWRWLGFANTAWFFGHGVWSYFQIIVGTPPKMPHWLQVFFVLHPMLLVLGLLRLPKPAGTSGLTPRHVGNLLLIACAVAVVFVVALWEPAQLPGRTWSANVIALLTASCLAAMCMTAVYLLWSYRWDGAYWPLLLIVLAAIIHTVTYVMNIHFRMTSAYSSYGWYNISWLLGFGAMACAAYERFWQTSHRLTETAEDAAARERWLEACVPALLILLMLIVTWLSSAWLTPLVAGLAISFAAVFALVLSARDLWIQKEEQRLLDALNRSNIDLSAANRDLSEGERRYRALNAELEQRVSARTTELQAAYRELEGFSYAVAHDIKAPLRAINAFGALLSQEYAQHLDERGLNYVQRMGTGALHVAQLVDDLLAYARVERLDLRLRKVDLRSLIDTCISEQRDEIARLGAEVSTDIEPHSIRVDETAMLQALRNLIQNSLKFSRDAKPPRIGLTAHRSGDNIHIAVADNGIGFDMQYHDQIFALFQRLHRPDQYSGTGIGLAIARKAIERMGGRMWARSKPNEGATFYIELPTARGGG